MNAFVKTSPFQSRRHIFAGAALLLTAWLPLPAQEAPGLEVPPDLAFIRLVNAVGLPGRLKVRINGNEADPAGFQQGDATGAVGLAPKSYPVELEHETLGKETLEVPLQTGQITTVIAYMTEKPALDPKTKKPAKGEAEKKGPRLAWHLDQSPTSPPDLKQPALTLVQLTPADEMDFKVSGTPVTVPAAKPVRVPITRAMGAFPGVHYQSKPVSLLNFKFPADQLVVFFIGDDGTLKQAPMRNDVQ